MPTWARWAARPVPLLWLVGLGALWGLLRAGDVLSTTHILQCSTACGHENNPLAALLWLRGGVVLLGLDKLLVTAILAAGAWLLARRWHAPWLALCTLLVCDALAAVALANTLWWVVVRERTPDEEGRPSTAERPARRAPRQAGARQRASRWPEPEHMGQGFGVG